MYTFKEKSCVNCGSDRSVEITQALDNRIKDYIRVVECMECGLVFLNPGPTEEDYISFYRSGKGGGGATPSRDKAIKDKQFEAPVLTDFLRCNIPDLSEMNAIDVGSGWGGFLHYLRPFVKKLSSIEIMPGAKELIRNNFDVDFVECSRVMEGFSQGTFDLITSIAVIEHYPEPLLALQDYYEALKEGGYLLIFTPDVLSMSFVNGPNSYFKFVHPYYYSVSTLQSLLRKIGFGDFTYWLSQPSLPLWSVRYPDLYAPGDIMLIARKITETGNGEEMIDHLETVREKYTQALLIDDRLKNARTLWLNNLSIPVRLLSKAVPYVRPNHYQYFAEQYWSTHGGLEYVHDSSINHKFDRFLSRMYYEMACKFS